jgi:predicted MFS family arabinose efflux permease
MVASQLVSRVHERVGERTLQLGGFVLMTALLTLFAVLNGEMGPWTIRITMFFIGFGSGNVQLPNQAMAFDEVTSADTGQASGLYNTSRRFGSAIGVAVLSSVLATSHTRAGAEAGFTASYVAAVLLTAGGLWVAVQALRTGGRRRLGKQPMQAA